MRWLVSPHFPGVGRHDDLRRGRSLYRVRRKERPTTVPFNMETAAKSVGRRILRVSIIAGTVGILLCVALWGWRQSVAKKRAVSSSVTLAKALESKDFERARSALPGLVDLSLRESKELEISTAEVQSALEIRDTDALRRITESETAVKLAPSLKEAADLELAREAMWNGNFPLCEELIDRWKTGAETPGRWILLRADLLLARREPDKAREFLENATLTGADDALRHARLALFHAREPWKAMESLDTGLRADPRNADLLSFRAQIQEAAGRIPDARLDYVAAVLSEPGNPLHRDVLANFQLRIGEPSNAADTWRDAAEVTGLGLYAFKAWFWSRMCGVPLSENLPEIRQEAWSELIPALAKMPSASFWSPALDIPLSKISGANFRPELEWLRLLEKVRNQEWSVAVGMLEKGFSREADRLAPGMASRLNANLAALAGADPRLVLVGAEVVPLSEESHPFLKEFEAWRKQAAGENPRFDQWLANPASPAATLFAHGWHGAALDLAGGVKLSLGPDAPEWFDFGYARCLLVREGADAALTWLKALPTRSSAAELSYAELRIAQGDAEAGFAILEKLSAGQSPQASRASWTLALAELDSGQLAKARERVHACPELAAAPAGREILARIALTEGKPDAALTIYQELGVNSVDAMIYLSKDAFAHKNWELARKWTGELARRFPSEPKFRKNLLKIDEEEAASQP